jgi:hypothetical protein
MIIAVIVRVLITIDLIMVPIMGMIRVIVTMMGVDFGIFLAMGMIIIQGVMSMGGDLIDVVVLVAMFIARMFMACVFMACRMGHRQNSGDAGPGKDGAASLDRANLAGLMDQVGGPHMQ